MTFELITAEKVIREVLEKKPDDFFARLQLADILEELDFSDEARMDEARMHRWLANNKKVYQYLGRFTVGGKTEPWHDSYTKAVRFIRSIASGDKYGLPPYIFDEINACRRILHFAELRGYDVIWGSPEDMYKDLIYLCKIAHRKGWI